MISCFKMNLKRYSCSPVLSSNTFNSVYGYLSCKGTRLGLELISKTSAFSKVEECICEIYFALSSEHLPFHSMFRKVLKIHCPYIVTYLARCFDNTSQNMHTKTLPALFTSIKQMGHKLKMHCM